MLNNNNFNVDCSFARLKSDLVFLLPVKTYEICVGYEKLKNWNKLYLSNIK